MKHAYLKTDTLEDYKDCKIQCYTYSFPDQLDVIHVNVNVHFKYYTQSLALDDTFELEQAAIDHGIAVGKKHIDQNGDADRYF